MKIAFAADLHLCHRSFKDSVIVLKSLIDSIIDNNCNVLFLLGDTFNATVLGDSNANTGTVIKTLQKELQRFIDSGINKKVYLLVGNHELGSFNQVTPLAIIENENIVLIDTIQTIKVNEIPILAFPSMNIDNVNETSVKEWSLHAAKNNFETVVFHAPLAGASTKNYTIKKCSTYITKELLELSNAKYIIGGDIHKRQSINIGCENNGYVGALRHVKQDEAGNPTGYRLIDYTTKEDKFVEIYSPQFIVVKAEDYKNNKEHYQELSEKHNVRVIGTTKELVELSIDKKRHGKIVFKKAAPENETTRRVQGEINADSNPIQLLDIWYSNSNINIDKFPIEEIREYLKTGLLDNYVPTQPGIGSLSRILSIRLKNIAKHKDTFIKFEDKNGFIYLEGDNGAGKTTLLDSIGLAIYGTSPGYEDNIINMIAQDFIGDAEVSVELISNNKVYKFERIIHITPSTRKHVFTIYENETKIAGGPDKLNNGDAKARELIGDKNLLFATIYAGQRNKDIVDLTGSERRMLLLSLMGTEGLITISNNAKAKKEKIDKEIIKKTTEKSTKNDAITRLNTSINSILVEDLKKEVENYNNEIEKKQEEIKILEEEKYRVSNNTQYIALKSNIQELENSKALVEKEIRDKNNEISKLDKSFELYKDILSTLNNSESIDSIKLKIEEEQSKFDYYTKETEEIQTIISSYRDQLNKIENEIRMKEMEFSSEYNKWNTSLLSAKNNLNSKILSIKNHLNNLITKRDNARNKSNILESSEIGCKGELDCKFLKDAKEAKESLNSIELEMSEVESQLEHIQDLEEQKLLVNIEKAEPQKLDLSLLKNRSLDISNKIEEYKIKLPNKIDLTKLRILQSDLSNISNIQDQANKLSYVEEALKNETSKKSELINTLSDIELKLTEKKNNLENIGDINGQIKEIQYKISIANNRIKELSNLKLQAEVKIQNVNELKLHIDSLEAEIKNIDNEILALYRELEFLTLIQKAYSKDGIPQLILDSILPRLEEISKVLLASAAYEGTLKFSTQSITQDNKINEAFLIEAWDSDIGKYRDISRFSDGEGSILRLATRLSFAILQSERTGNRIDVFIADETFKSLIPSRVLDAINMLLSLNDKFQIFITSHYPEIAAIMKKEATVVKVTKVGDTSTAIIAEREK